MNMRLWTSLVAALPEGLTVQQAAKILRRSPAITRRKLVALGYKYTIKQKSRYHNPEWIRTVNWKMSNIEIARTFGKSRERIRIIRGKLGKAKVESRGRKNNNNGKAKLANNNKAACKN